ncbi:MAG: hypothetical protein RIG84_08995, partial [Roseovarius sp.]
ALALKARVVARGLAANPGAAGDGLAKLWNPNIPTIENTAYISRAQELEKDLETMLLSQLEETAAVDLPDKDKDGA